MRWATSGWRVLQGKQPIVFIEMYSGNEEKSEINNGRVTTDDRRHDTPGARRPPSTTAPAAPVTREASNSCINCIHMAAKTLLYCIVFTQHRQRCESKGKKGKKYTWTTLKLTTVYCCLQSGFAAAALASAAPSAS